MQNTKTVLVPFSMHEAGTALLAARADVRVQPYDPALTGSALHEVLAAAAGVALSYTAFGRPELAAAPGLRVAARLGVGFDAVDVPALTQARVPLMVAGIANAASVAEHAIFLMFTLAKRGPAMDAMVRRGERHMRKAAMPGELAGKTVLLVGFGRIGSRVAPRCQALGMRVLVHDPYVDAARVRECGCEPVAALDAALGMADYVSLHCPRNAETEAMFDAARLARMKPGAFLVNTARGGLVAEAALADALREGRLGGAGLDVFDLEPPDPSHPLLHVPGLVASPHMAGVTTESVVRMAEVTAANILSVLDGAPVLGNVINPEALA